MTIFNSLINFIPPKLREYIIFIFGGGIGALINWIISFLLTSIIGVHYIAAYSTAQIFNITVNFLWHQHITFNVQEKSKLQFIKFILMSIVTALISILLVYIMKEFVLDKLYTVYILKYNINYLVTIIVITFVVSIINYILSRIWVFDVQDNTAFSE